MDSWRETHRLRSPGSAGIRSSSRRASTENCLSSGGLTSWATNVSRSLWTGFRPSKSLPRITSGKDSSPPRLYRALLTALPAHLQPITCVAFHVANRKGNCSSWNRPDVDLSGDPPVITLWPGETKSGDGRTLPILQGEMLDTMRR